MIYGIVYRSLRRLVEINASAELFQSANVNDASCTWASTEIANAFSHLVLKIRISMCVAALQRIYDSVISLIDALFARK